MPSFEHGLFRFQIISRSRKGHRRCSEEGRNTKTDRRYGSSIDHEVISENSKEVLELNYLSKLCSGDWGLEKTVLDNIDKIGVSIDKHEFVLPNDKERLREKLNHLQEAIRKRRKDIGWRLRDLIGTRMKWYSVIEMGEGEA